VPAPANSARAGSSDRGGTSGRRAEPQRLRLDTILATKPKPDRDAGREPLPFLCLKCDGIDTEVLAAYDCSVDALGELGAEIVDVSLPARFADLGAINGRIMSAEAYAALAGLVDEDAQPLDQGVRPRVRDDAVISSRGCQDAASQ